MVMSCQYAPQYNTQCVRLEGGEVFEEVVNMAYDCGATYDDGEDECFVIEFPGRPQELYTEEALRRSLTPGWTAEPVNAEGKTGERS